jgi:hypothetical protein
VHWASWPRSFSGKDDDDDDDDDIHEDKDDDEDGDDVDERPLFSTRPPSGGLALPYGAAVVLSVLWELGHAFREVVIDAKVAGGPRGDGTVDSQWWSSW